MGKHRTAEERLAHAERLVEKFKTLQEGHESRAKRHRERQDFQRSGDAQRMAEKAESNKRKWQKAAKQAREKIILRDAMTTRAPSRPGREPAPVLTDSQKRAMERDEKARRLKVAQKGKRLSAAAVRHDERTALGERTYDIVNLGSTMRASVNHFAACIRKPADRTDTRLLAWQAFDRHYHDVSAGLIPPPRFEPGVDTSSTPGVADARLAALNADHGLQLELGAHLHNLLVQVVHHGHHMRDLPGLSALDPRSRTVLLLHALDLAAAYWRLNEVKKVRTRVSHVALDMSSTD